jgi:hypothetical protein
MDEKFSVEHGSYLRTTQNKEIVMTLVGNSATTVCYFLSLCFYCMYLQATFENIIH